MKLHITVTGSAPFTIDVEKDVTVAQFKEMITSDPHFPKNMVYDSIRIIHFGKFLEDNEKTLEDYKVTEGGRLIIYVQKKPAPPPASKPAPATPVESPETDKKSDNEGTSNTPNASSTSSAAPQAQPAAPAPAPAPVPVSAPTPAPAPAVPQGPQVDPAKLEQLRSMGFPELESRKALAASRGNIELAVDYLVSGNIPEAPAQPAGGMGAGPIAAPVGITQEQVDQIMTYLQQTDPETYSQVRANPALLTQILQQAGMLAGQQLPVPAAGAVGTGAADGTGAMSIVLSEAEQQQVQQVSEITGLDAERVKVIFVRLGRSPDATCDIIFEYGDRFRLLTPAQLDAMFLQMQRGHMGPGGAGAGAGGAYRYDSDDDGDSSSSESNGSDEDNGGDDDDFYL